MKPLVIYHRDADGMCAALVLHETFGEIDAVSAQYGEAPPSDDEVRDRDIWIVDFSYPGGQLARIKELSRSLVVLDHHKWAKTYGAGLDYVTFDGDCSGASMTLERVVVGGWYNPKKNVWRTTALRKLVAYVADRDLWQWKMPKSREFSAWLSNHRLNLPAWIEILDSLEDEYETHQNFSGSCVAGAAFLCRDNNLIGRLCPKARKAKLIGWDGITVLVINTPLFASEVGEALHNDADLVCCWQQTRDGDFVYQLRSRGEPAGGADVTAFAEAHGGGGHESGKTAGFHSDEWPDAYFDWTTEGDDTP